MLFSTGYLLNIGIAYFAGSLLRPASSDGWEIRQTAQAAPATCKQQAVAATGQTLTKFSLVYSTKPEGHRPMWQHIYKWRTGDNIYIYKRNSACKTRRLA